MLELKRSSIALVITVIIWGLLTDTALVLRGRPSFLCGEVPCACLALQGDVFRSVRSSSTDDTCVFGSQSLAGWTVLWMKVDMQCYHSIVYTNQNVFRAHSRVKHNVHDFIYHPHEMPVYCRFTPLTLVPTHSITHNLTISWSQLMNARMIFLSTQHPQYPPVGLILSITLLIRRPPRAFRIF
jgi:hypothetical protein